MKNISTRLFPFFICLLFGGMVSAQDMEILDATTPPVTPTNLISNYFLGDGVEVIDITFNGDPVAVGYFKNGLEEVGIERGIIMTSGRAAAVNCNGGQLGANCVGNQFSSNATSSSASDPDLNAISTNPIQDACKYTITFIPTSDTLRFRYVFASEEYPEYACSPFNDVFGFFISGPGINGTFENNGINIARVPVTNEPVTINNVHPANGPGCAPKNAQYYNAHNTSNNQPVYDGYLDVFTAEVVVIPCETYTIKLMVADASDQAFDTGVFLEAKSFGTGSLKVETATVSLDGTLAEGCSNGIVTFSLPGAAEANFPLDYTIVGTATNGVDYVQIPANLFIPQGDSSLTIDIIGIEDNLAEGLESIGIDIQRDPCNRDTFWIFIRDNEILPPQLGDDTTLCRGDTAQLDATLPIPLPVPPSFTNQNDYPVPFNVPVYSPIIVAGVQPTILQPGVIQSVCVNYSHKFVDDVDLFLISPGGQFIELVTDHGSNCDDYHVCFTPESSQVISYNWPLPPCTANVQASFNGSDWLPEGIWSDLWDGEFPTNGTWQLLALDDAQGFDGTLLDWTITFEPLYKVNYRWEPGTGLSCDDCPNPKAFPDQTTTYTVTAWDSYGCEVYDSITVEVSDAIPAPNVSCTEVTPNSITFGWDASPDAQGYQVNVNGQGWTTPNDGAVSHIISSLQLEDTITIQVLPIGTCEGQVGTATCFTPACNSASLSIVDQQSVSCNGNTDGSVMVSASGGAGNFTYSLGASQNTSGAFTGLPAGQYNVVVLDAWNCPNSLTVTIGEPEELEAQGVVLNEISCNGGSDGNATVEVIGGTAPFSFLWDGSVPDSIAANLPPGAHSVLVTDANGCTTNASVSLSQPPAISLQTNAGNATCFGIADGTATVSASGGSGAFQFQWDAAASNQTGATAQNLPAGTYSVSATDLNGCLETATVTVGEPAALNTGVNFNNPSCDGDANGSASVTVSGGAGNFQYFWSNNGSASNIDNLAAGIYFVTVSDANSCTAVDTAVLVAPPPILIALVASPTSCFASNDGQIQAQVSGGNPGNYGYSWSNGGAGATISGVLAGNYCVTVLDAQGCSATACENVTQPSEIQLSTIVANAGCDGGTSGAINLSVSGGASPYTFAWSNGQVSEDLEDLPAGQYTVNVTDANNCNNSTTVNVSETDAILLQITPDDVTCKGGSDGNISLTASGGTSNFTFQWTGDNGFTSNLEDPANLLAGNYSVQATDSDGCIATAAVTITEPATAVVASIAPANLICFGANTGTATATATGGSQPYTFSWSNGQSGATANNLNAAIFTVTATDLVGCTDTEQVEILQEAPLLVTLSQTPATCHNGSDGSAEISSITQGGSSVPFNQVTIQWSVPGQTSPSIGSLTGGQSYLVTVTNALGCEVAAEISIENPPAVVASILGKTDVKCAGGRDGSATVAGIGGVSPFTFQWSGNAGSQTTATAADLPTGDFTVTITDSKGCTATTSVTLDEPSELKLRFENQDIPCFGEDAGASLAEGEGGVPPYQFLWSTGASTVEISNQPAGKYSLILTDFNGCTIVDSTEIRQPQAPLTAATFPEDVTCFGSKNGKIEIEPSGGTPPYLYSLDGVNFNGSPVQIALEPGSYDLFIKDGNGCLFEENDVLVNEPPEIELDLGADVVVPYGNPIAIEPIIENADTNQLTYNWTSYNPQVPPLNPVTKVSGFIVTSPTTVRLVVADSNGCKAEDLLNIFVQEYRSIQVPTGFTPTSDGVNDLLHVHGSSQMVRKIKRFQVFDRWGELVYEWFDFAINDTSVGWDGTFKGKEMPSGVYAWYLEVEFVDDSVESYKGHTTLIR